MIEHSDNEPCTCPVAEEYPHTVRQHWAESCSYHDRCGGCYQCLCAQQAHYEQRRLAS